MRAATRIDAPRPAPATGPARPLAVRFYHQPGIDPGLGVAIRPDGSIRAFAVNLAPSAALDLAARLGDGLALAAAFDALPRGQGGPT